MTRDADLGRRLADTLVQVWRREGMDAWVLIHVEVQGQPEHDFARRMFVYYFRIFDRYERPLMSVAVLGDYRVIPTAAPLDRVRVSLLACEAGQCVLVKADSHRLGRRPPRGQLVRAKRRCLIPQRLVKLVSGPEGMLLSLAGKLRAVLQPVHCHQRRLPFRAHLIFLDVHSAVVLDCWHLWLSRPGSTLHER